MMLDKVKKYVCENKGKVIDFRLNNGRNQIFQFKGVITDVYKSIFIVKLCDSGIVKSFSYADVLIGNLVFEI